MASGGWASTPGALAPSSRLSVPWMVPMVRAQLCSQPELHPSGWLWGGRPPDPPPSFSRGSLISASEVNPSNQSCSRKLVPCSPCRTSLFPSVPSWYSLWDSSSVFSVCVLGGGSSQNQQEVKHKIKGKNQAWRESYKELLPQL